MSTIRVVEPGFFTKTSYIQLGYGVWASMNAVGVGLAFGFSAVAIPQLQDTGSNLKTTLSEDAWITSVLTLSSPIGCLVCGCLMDRLGRRFVMTLCNIPLALGWIYTGVANNAQNMIVGRIITGIGCGMAMGPPRAYVTEISLPNMRGVVGALPTLATAVGLTLQAGMGSLLHWKSLCFLCGSYSSILILTNLFLPETPYFVLMSKGIEKGKESLKKFRAKDYDFDKEIEDLIDFKNCNNICSLSSQEAFQALFQISACKPFWIIMPYILIGQLSGISILIFWTVEILEASESSVNSNIGNVILALTRLFSGMLVSVLIYKVRRRILALTSSVGVTVVCISLGFLIIYSSEQTVVPQLLYMLYILFSTLGYYTLPLMMMYEISPLQIRGLVGGISISATNIFMFGANKGFPYVRKLLGYPCTIHAFGIWSLIGSIYLYFFLPETKGLTLQEIEEYFNNRRSTLISQREVMDIQMAESVSMARQSLSALRVLNRSKSLERHKLSKSDENDHSKDNDEEYDGVARSTTPPRDKKS